MALTPVLIPETGSENGSLDNADYFIEFIHFPSIAPNATRTPIATTLPIPTAASGPPKRLKRTHMGLLTGSFPEYEYEWYNYVHNPMCCPTSGVCCQYGKAPLSFSSHVLSNDSLINRRSDYVRYALPDPELNDIPVYKGADNVGTVAIWVIAALLGCMFIFLIGLIV
jgi:hypothetical protein